MVEPGYFTGGPLWCCRRSSVISNHDALSATKICHCGRNQGSVSSVPSARPTPRSG